LTPSQSSIQEKPKEEYTDTKTGHIYVQGAITEDPGQQHMVLERVKFKLEEVFDTTRSVLFAQKKWLRKGKKQLIITIGILNEESRSLGKKLDEHQDDSGEDIKQQRRNIFQKMSPHHQKKSCHQPSLTTRLLHLLLPPLKK
jgi:hypothetical protein